MKARLLIVIAAALPLFVAACGNSSTSPSNVSSINVTGAAPAIGATAQFTAVATMTDGSTQDVTNLAAWTSSNTGDATVSATGVVTGVGAGAAAISATYSNVTGVEQITVP